MTLEVRTEADIDLMRHYLSLTSAECPILPTLHGISAFGSKLSFYKAQSDYQGPPTGLGGILSHLHCTETAAPESCWDCDLIDGEGARRFKRIMREIKRACTSP